MTAPTEWQLATRHLGHRVLLFERIDSTNSYAVQLGGEVCNDGIVVLAREQTAGRGQYGRTWQAPAAASVLMSVVAFPPPSVQRPALLTAWAAVSVCALIQRLTGLQATIKWPNDVLLQGRKACGILIEQRSSAGRLATVAGIGLNLNQTAAWFQEAGLAEATSLGLVSGAHHEWEDVARGLILELDDQYHRLLQGDRATLEACWKGRLGLLRKEVVVEGANETHRGVLCDMTFDGLELLAASGKLVRLVPEAVRHVYEASGDE
jgi:BirA family biotin operon repressor/biotin-[acetyl-CoA-carboxylase] ligase